MKPCVELLAPAGSMESMVAAINAGADAVYMGGSRFGARAYADNPEEDRFLKAIDYAHLHNRKLYMTVNTLVKEDELEQMTDFLSPFYRQGLDAAIVQDMGVFALIREEFPDLPIHASTQMTVTGYRSARRLKDLGASRVVTARELSLEEIARISRQVDIEIETFVHGALCYSYSGQCLLSSFIGGRSGNRGRCAQPCRLPYEACQSAVNQTGRGRAYMMNMKDLCVLDILPDILESGVSSLKIEGRMKSPRYTAGVVSIYRKYVDLYFDRKRDGYRVRPEDRETLLKLFDRGGFTEGYYRKQNGRDMIALGEKPAFREVDSSLFACLDEKYVNQKKQEPVDGRLTVREGEAAALQLGDEITVTGDIVQTALNQPVTEEKLRRQLNKTGNSPFYFRNLEVELAGNCFLPVQSFNELRRQGLERWEEFLLEPYRRPWPLPNRESRLRFPEAGENIGQRPNTKEQVNVGDRLSVEKRANVEEMPSVEKRADVEEMPSVEKRADTGKGPRPRLHVSLETWEGFDVIIAHSDVDQVYVDAGGFEADQWKRAAEKCHEAGKGCVLAMPYIFRTKAEQYFQDHLSELRSAGFDGVLLRSLEEGEYLREQNIEIPRIFDANLYAMNHLAAAFMTEEGALRLTLPLELNSRELEKLSAWQGGREGWEAVVYGYLPAMVSAQCIRKTIQKCTRRPEVIYIKDRTGKSLPVKNHCRFCYNVLYNPEPLSLLGQKRLVERLRVAAVRLQFTKEAPEQVRAVTDAYAGYFYHGKEAPELFSAFTRGHWKRGVE